MFNHQKWFESKKKIANILILGPYGECKPKLIGLRNYIISRGFENAKLVIDFPDEKYDEIKEDIYFLEKSKNYIKEWAEILLFVIDQECNNDSVLAEFFYTVESVNHKIKFTAILASTQRYLGRLLRGTIQLHRVRLREFSDIGELNRKGYSAAFNMLQNMKY